MSGIIFNRHQPDMSSQIGHHPIGFCRAELPIVGETENGKPRDIDSVAVLMLRATWGSNGSPTNRVKQSLLFFWASEARQINLTATPDVDDLAKPPDSYGQPWVDSV